LTRSSFRDVKQRFPIRAFYPFRERHRQNDTYVSGELGHVTVVVFQKVAIDRDVGRAVHDAGERAVRPVAGPPVPVIDLAVVGRLGHVHRCRVHLGGQQRGERAVLSHVR